MREAVGATEFEEFSDCFEGDGVVGICGATEYHGYDRLSVPYGPCHAWRPAGCSVARRPDDAVVFNGGELV